MRISLRGCVLDIGRQDAFGKREMVIARTIAILDRGRGVDAGRGTNAEAGRLDDSSSRQIGAVRGKICGVRQPAIGRREGNPATE